jgi:predicted nucleotidyltransferase
MRRSDSLRRIAERFGLELIVLFGSRARGRGRADSDTDVAVLARSGRRPDIARDMDLTEALARALRAPEGVDLVWLHRASPLLQFEAARRGRALYRRSRGSFSRFRLYAARRYDDNRKFFEALARHVGRRSA